MHMKSCALVVILATLFIGTFCLSSVISSSTNLITIKSSGQISTANATAASGYWRDIQNAINWIVAHGGKGNVHIPVGTWNFVNVNESWSTARVTVPAGINIFGAPVETYSNGSVVAWNTVLVMPWDMPENPDHDDNPVWFEADGNGAYSSLGFEFSDIKMVGYRYFDNQSCYMHRSIDVNNIVNFRIDHDCFQDICAGMGTYGATCNGVIDHCVLNNTVGNPGRYGDCAPYDDYTVRTVGYGILIARTNTEGSWDPNLQDVAGQYTNYTVVIEDCYFSRWRHDICTQQGAACVVRHCIFDSDYMVGDVDAHGAYDVLLYPNRCVEIYDNVFINPYGLDYTYTARIYLNGQVYGGVTYPTYPGGRGPFYTLHGGRNPIQIRGGATFIFNNTEQGANSDSFTILTSDGIGLDGLGPAGPCYLWNNTYASATYVDGTGYVTAYSQPSWYTPYQYPHPLTLITFP